MRFEKLLDLDPREKKPVQGLKLMEVKESGKKRSLPKLQPT
jgi:hypothetical protein